jgi:hypothetical protein
MSNDAISKALATWYDKDHPLHLDPLHPAIKLAGEAGELLDLYGKHKYKPGFDWWQCKYCGQGKDRHYDSDYCKSEPTKKYNSFVLDELGDWWYYWRVLCYQDELSAWDTIAIHQPENQEILKVLREISRLSLYVLDDYDEAGLINTDELSNAFTWFADLLNILDIDLDNLTELNYAKLNSDASNHGWKGATVK